MLLFQRGFVVGAVPTVPGSVQSGQTLLNGHHPLQVNYLSTPET